MPLKPNQPFIKMVPPDPWPSLLNSFSKKLVVQVEHIYGLYLKGVNID